LTGKGKFRATITGYDCEYKDTTNGHASGGALSLLWHEDAGLIFSASMNTYQLIEAHNMQVDDDPHAMCITPRVEMENEGTRYMNISDLHATIAMNDGDPLTFTVRSKLVDRNQKSPSTGDVRADASYVFFNDQVRLVWKTSGVETTSIIFPIVAKSTDQLEVISPQEIVVRKEKCKLRVSSNVPIILLPSTRGRVFNFVPGVEVIPLACNGNDVTINLAVE
jgi:hypothetical protein